MQSSAGQDKKPITKAEFASLLHYCLYKGFGFGEEPLAEQLAELARDIGYEIDDDTLRLYYEMLVLFMWVIVRSCTKALHDVDKRNACLDLFHREVYEHHMKSRRDEDYAQWYKGMGLKYLEYEKATESSDEPGPTWSALKVANKNIFGEVKKDPLVLAHIGNRAFALMEHVDTMLKEVLGKSEIE